MSSEDSIVTITHTDTNDNGLISLFMLFITYFVILIYYALINNNGSNNGLLNNSAGTPVFVYLLLMLIVGYTIYSIYNVFTNKNISQLKNMNFWEESFYLAFALSAGVLVSGMCVGCQVNAAAYAKISLFIFILVFGFSTMWQISGVTDNIFKTSISNIKCKSSKNNVDLDDCVNTNNNSIKTTNSTKTNLIICGLLLFAVIFVPSFSYLSNRYSFSGSSSDFIFMDSFFGGLFGGIVAILGLHFVNYRRTGNMLSQSKSTFVMLFYIAFNFMLKYTNIV